MAVAERIEFPISAPGARQAASDFTALSTSMERAERSVGQSASTFRGVSTSLATSSKAANDNAKSFGTLAVSAQRITPAFSAFGASVSRLAPALGGVANAVGRAGGAMAGMTSVIGGVGGLAAGGLVAGLGILIDYLSRTKTLQEEIAESTEKASKAMEAQRIAAETSPLGVARRKEEARKAADQRRPFLQQQLADVVAYGGDLTDEQYEALKAQQEKAFQDALNAAGGMPDEARSQADVMREMISRGERDNRAYQQRLQQESTARGITARQGLGFRDTTGLGLREQMGDISGGNLQQEARQRLTQDLRDGTSELERMTAGYNELREAGQGAFQDIGRAGIQAFAALARGDRNAGKALLSTIGDLLVGRGTDAIFQGLILNANPLTPGAGFPLIAVGGAAVGAGVALGAATAAPTGAGGGGGFAARPVQPGSGLGGANQQRVVNIHYRSIVPPNAEDGRRIKRFIEEADRDGL